MIKTVGLKKVYRTDEVETTALENVNIEIEEGEFVAVMGPSGCGKTTLLNILGMLDKFTVGEYHFNGKQISNNSERELASLRKKNIGFVFQSFNLIDELTVYENIELPLYYLKIPGGERKKRVTELMEQMNILPRRNHYPQQLSGGQQQRVAVARAVVTRPRMILADEPTGNLDSTNGEEVMKILESLNKNGTTIAMVTHSPYYADYAGRIIHLFDGHVVTENYKGKTDA